VNEAYGVSTQFLNTVQCLVFWFSTVILGLTTECLIVSVLKISRYLTQLCSFGSKIRSYAFLGFIIQRFDSLRVG